MTLQVACSNCGRTLRVDDTTVGKQIKCPQCAFILGVQDDAKSAPQVEDAWYLKTKDARSYGPVPRQELDEWVREGRVTHDCQILKDGSQQWQWAGEMYPQLVPVNGNKRQIEARRPASAPPGDQTLSDRSKLVAGLLGLIFPFLGLNGIHRFYTGHILIGILMLITAGGCGIWQIIDVILVFSGAVNDVDGRPLRD